MMRSVIRQPLMQFLVIGALVVLLDAAFVPREDDPRRIVIDDATYAEIAGIFRDNRGRAPTEKEMEELTRVWAQNEVLYREALLLELDEGDEMIRSRMVLKLRDALFRRVAVQKPDETGLREWFDQHREQFDKPSSVDFEQFVVGERDDARETFEALAADISGAPAPEEYAARVRMYTRRPEPSLSAVFGEKDAAKLLDAADGAWVVVDSQTKLHLARVTARYPGEPVAFDEVRTRVGELYASVKREQQMQSMLREIGKKYDIVVKLTENPANLVVADIERDLMSDQVALRGSL